VYDDVFQACDRLESLLNEVRSSRRQDLSDQPSTSLPHASI
jgi:hypothetical protein